MEYLGVFIRLCLNNRHNVNNYLLVRRLSLSYPTHGCVNRERARFPMRFNDASHLVGVLSRENIVLKFNTGKLLGLISEICYRGIEYNIPMLKLAHNRE